jgi:[acyl-carrier-protein] S-malonyltransferase
METLAFVFPGQGSQQEGMGSDLLADDPGYRSLIAEANRLAGTDVTRSPNPEQGPSTVATQLSVFALSVSLGRRLVDGGLVPRTVAGHSLGEFSALVVGGWLDIEAGLELVAERAAAMQRCCDASDGAMVALLRAGDDDLAALLHGTEAVVANLNSPRQTVVSGPPADIAEVARRAAGSEIRALELPVAGAFHSPLMAGAEDTLREAILRLPLSHGTIPLISSVTGRPVDDLDRYRADLAGQITAPVRWLDVMRAIDELGPHVAGRVVEVGPGAVLRGLFRHVDRRWPVELCGDLAACAPLLKTREPVAA